MTDLPPDTDSPAEQPDDDVDRSGGADSRGAQRLSIDIVSDERMSAAVAETIARRMPGHGHRADGTPCVLETTALGAEYRPSAVGDPPVEQLVAAARLPTSSDLALYLVEMPRIDTGRMVLAETDARRTAVIYLPAMGTLGVRRRTVAVVVEIIHRLLGVRLDPHTRAERRWVQHRRTPGVWREREQARGDGRNHQLRAAGPGSRIRLVGGMVRANRPWRLVPTLSGALAAAIGTAAFGVFYSSIWEMAVAMSNLRLLWIAVTAVAAMTAWLIIPNRLWETRRFRAQPGDRAVYNAATIGTIGAGVLGMYVLLFVAVLIAAFVVIPAEFLTAQIGRDSGLSGYLKLGWLAASLGTFAGAVGSGVAEREEILHATYGYREVQRRKARERAEDRRRDAEHQ